MKADAMQTVMRSLIPAEILESFELEEVDDSRATQIRFHLVEKETCRPEVGVELMKDGYMRPKEIQHFPIGERKMVLVLKRRRWVNRRDRNESHFNRYAFTEEKCKLTPQLSAFFKEAGWEEPV